MRCVNHGEREAVGRCNNCGRDFCAECLIDVNGGPLCKECVSVLAGKPQRTPAYPHYGTYHERSKQPSKFLLFILSALPGLGYMYLGLIKRGLLVMAAFFLNIYLMAQFELPMLAFVIPILFFASFFDGFKILRSIRAGINVEDTVDDLLGFVVKHKIFIFGALAVMIALGFLQNMWRWGFAYGSGIVPLLVIVGVAAYFIFVRGGKRFPKRDMRYEDKKDDNRNGQQ